MSGRRRRRGPRRLLPWLFTAALVVLVGRSLLNALGERDLVAAARNLRTGDATTAEPPDPIAALDVLDAFLDRHPGHYEALVEIAKCWQDLRAWDKSVNALRAAAENTADLALKTRAMTDAMFVLQIADRHEEAVAMGRAVIELLPEDLRRRLQLGHVYLRGSQSAQAKVLARSVDPAQKRWRDLQVEQRIESFVTDIWREPDVEDLLDELLPAADPILRQEVRAELVEARESFLQADAILADYPRLAGFDPMASRARVNVLQRTGRLYDAHIEAGMCLAEPALPLGVQRDFLDAQAQCSILVGQPGLAADLYERIVQSHEAAGERPPAWLIWALYEQRVAAAQWDWILARVETDLPLWNQDATLRWARAEALAGTGRTAEARDAILDPLASATLGTRTSTSASIRGYPKRRRAIIMLGYRLFQEIGDPRALSALDGLLLHIPDDAEALRLRSDLAREQNRPEAAMHDAFALLVRERRERPDFDRWVAAADALSQQQHGAGLAARARAKVRDADSWLRSTDEASFETYKVLGVALPATRVPDLPNQLYVPRDPALSWAIVEELAAAGRLERARGELRKLSDAHTGVQEFRFRLGRLLVREGQYESAAAEFERLLQDVPGDTEALDLAVRTWKALGRPDRAAQLVSRMILDDPLGVGAARYGELLLARGQPEAAKALVERLVRWTDFDQRLDVLIVAARAQLALGDAAGAQAILAALATRFPDSVEVAVLGLDIGLDSGQSGLVDAAVETLAPLAPGFFPDQMEAIAARLQAAGLHDALVTIFDDEVTELPAARPALRAVASAFKSRGEYDVAQRLLDRIHDGEALLDAFLIDALAGQTDAACRRLRLAPAHAERGGLAELCLLAGQALLDRPALVDGQPLERLASLDLAPLLDPADLQLLDGLLRLLPQAMRLDEIRPPSLLAEPAGRWPLAAEDLARLVEIARADPARARAVGKDLVFLCLLGERPFWLAEARQIAEHARLLAPELREPLRRLARLELAAGRPDDALGLMPALVGSEVPRLDDLTLFLDAAADLDRTDWGAAMALFFADQPGVLRELAQRLGAWGHLPEAVQVAQQALARQPSDPDTVEQLIALLGRLRRQDELCALLRSQADTFGERPEIRAAASAALSGFPRPSPEALEILQRLALVDASDIVAAEALARASEQPDERRLILERLVAGLDPRTLALSDAETARRHSIVLVRAARTARVNGLGEIARALSELALALDPGNIALYRELAFLEREQGHLDTARRYFEVLSFVDLNDRESAMALAELYFAQLGQPTRAAEVVRRTWTSTMPPSAVEILSAEAYLLGRTEDAIRMFYAVANSPLLTHETYLTVARIAYASGTREGAALLVDLALQKTPADHPWRARFEWLAAQRLPAPPTVPVAGAAEPATDAPGAAGG